MLVKPDRCSFDTVWTRFEIWLCVTEALPFLPWQYCYSHTHTGHEPDLRQVKMGGNSPEIDGNLHKVRIETARYGFCIQMYNVK
jgi:hypothetical protein